MLGAIELSTIHGLISFGDGAANDRLTLAISTVSAGSRVNTDGDFTAGVADVLVPASDRIQDCPVNAIGSQFGFTSTEFSSSTQLRPPRRRSLWPEAHTTAHHLGSDIRTPPTSFCARHAPRSRSWTALVGSMTPTLASGTVRRGPAPGRASTLRRTGVSKLGRGPSRRRVQLIPGQPREAVQSLPRRRGDHFDVSYEQTHGMQAGFRPPTAGHSRLHSCRPLGLAFETSPATGNGHDQTRSLSLSLRAFSPTSSPKSTDRSRDRPGPGLAAESTRPPMGIRGVAGFRVDLGSFSRAVVSLSWVTRDRGYERRRGPFRSRMRRAWGREGLRIGAPRYRWQRGLLPFVGIA